MRIDTEFKSTPETPAPCGGKIPDSGKNGSYYDVTAVSMRGEDCGMSYLASCIDIITALNMTFAEGEAFKAIWRKAAARQGSVKSDHSPLYDAEKVTYYGRIMEKMERLGVRK